MWWIILSPVKECKLLLMNISLSIYYRNQCQHCRLKKCFKMGLRREGESQPQPLSSILVHSMSKFTESLLNQFRHSMKYFQLSSRAEVPPPLNLWPASLSAEISPAGLAQEVEPTAPATSPPTSASWWELSPTLGPATPTSSSRTWSG